MEQILQEKRPVRIMKLRTVRKNSSHQSSAKSVNLKYSPEPISPKISTKRRKIGRKSAGARRKYGVHECPASASREEDRYEDRRSPEESTIEFVDEPILRVPKTEPIFPTDSSTDFPHKDPICITDSPTDYQICPQDSSADFIDKKTVCTTDLHHPNSKNSPGKIHWKNSEKFRQIKFDKIDQPISLPNFPEQSPNLSEISETEKWNQECMIKTELILPEDNFEHNSPNETDFLQQAQSIVKLKISKNIFDAKNSEESCKEKDRKSSQKLPISPPNQDGNPTCASSPENLVKNFNASRRLKIVNEFDLEKIYRDNNFSFSWGNIASCSDTDLYKVSEISSPVDEDFQILSKIICSVFSVPMNCGYFTEDERHLIFAILTLAPQEQIFFMNILLRAQGNWFCARDHNHGMNPDVAIDQEWLEKILQKGVFQSAYDSTDGSFFSIFDIEFLSKMYEKLTLKAPPYGKIITTLTNLLRQETDLKDKSEQPLKFYLNTEKGPILRLPPTLLSLIHRLLTLYFPSHTLTHRLPQIFSTITEALDPSNPTTYPSYPISHLPLFSNRLSLISYVEAKRTFKQVHRIIENRNPAYVVKLNHYGGIVMQKLEVLLSQSPPTDPTGPTDPTDPTGPKAEEAERPCWKRFSPLYLLSEILTTIIVVFRKSRSRKVLSTEYLTFLLNNRSRIPIDSAVLYKELIRIESHQAKGFDRVGMAMSSAFRSLKDLHNEIHMTEMLEIVSEWCNTTAAQDVFKEQIEGLVERTMKQYFILGLSERKIAVSPGLEGGNMWKGPKESDRQAYERLRDFAVQHYASLGYDSSIKNCEALPSTIFACLFWDAIYQVEANSGAFVCRFQKGPLDLFEGSFFVRQKERLLRRLNALMRMPETAVLRLMTGVYRRNLGVLSIISHEFGDAEVFRSMLNCLGKMGTLGICQGLIHGKCPIWGFPDLFVWGDKVIHYKILVFRASKKKTTMAQKMWLKVLSDAGVNVQCFTFNVNLISTQPARKIK